MLKSESYKKGLVFSTGLNIIAKGIGFINSLVLVYYFGTSISTDIYFYVLAVALLITNTINGIDYLVLIPEAMRLREQEGEKNSQHFLNFFTWIYAAIGIIIAILILLAPILFYSFFSKFDASSLEHNKNMLYIGCILIIFQLLNNFLNAILVSYKYFTIPILTGLINSIFSITLTLILHKTVGVAGTMLGITAGYFINFILLVVLLKKYQHWDFFSFRMMKNKIVWKNIGLVEINILPVWVRNYITLYLLTGLGSGIITSINLGQLLASLPEVFILAQISAIIGIKFSELSSKKDYKETTNLLVDMINTLFTLLIPLAVVMAVCNKEIIQLAFQRGNFTENSTSVTAFCFFYFSLLIPSRIYDIIFTRLFTSFQVYGLSTLIAVTGHVIITVITYFAITNFKLTGYFISQMIGYYLIMPALFYIILLIKLKKIETKNITRSFLFVVVLFPLVYIVCYLIYTTLHLHIIVNIFIITAVAFLLTITISKYLFDLRYLWVNFIFAKQKLKQLFLK